MADAYIVFDKTAKDAVMNQVRKVDQSFKELETKSVTKEVIRTSSRYFERGGVLTGCDIVLSTNANYQAQLVALVGENVR